MGKKPYTFGDSNILIRIEILLYYYSIDAFRLPSSPGKRKKTSLCSPCLCGEINFICLRVANMKYGGILSLLLAS